MFSDLIDGRALKVLANGMAYFRDETPQARCYTFGLPPEMETAIP